MCWCTVVPNKVDVGETPYGLEKNVIFLVGGKINGVNAASKIVPLFHLTLGAKVTVALVTCVTLPTEHLVYAVMYN